MKNKTARGYLLNTIVIVLLFTGFQILTSIKGSEGAFKLVIVPSLWQCCYLMLLAASLNLVLGFMGQLSLGHCGFMAIGAYTAAIMSTRLGTPFLINFLCAFLIAGAFGFVVGLPTLRIKGRYLPIITMGFCEIIRLVELNWMSFTRGAMGIGNIPTFFLFGIRIIIKCEFQCTDKCDDKCCTVLPNCPAYGRLIPAVLVFDVIPFIGHTGIYHRRIHDLSGHPLQRGIVEAFRIKLRSVFILQRDFNGNG